MIIFKDALSIVIPKKDRDLFLLCTITTPSLTISSGGTFGSWGGGGRNSPPHGPATNESRQINK